MQVDRAEVQVEPAEPGVAIWKGAGLRVAIHDLDRDWHRRWRQPDVSEYDAPVAVVYCLTHQFEPKCLFLEPGILKVAEVIEHMTQVALRQSDIGWCCPIGHPGRYDVEVWREIPGLTELQDHLFDADYHG
ncbi:MAG: hypothetical protein M3O87_01900 [Candidatus Dormibacteraeota bacterium]|nr:hypothetical protein [Candidatus Dormibacteraeota bacterium]